MTDKFIVGKKYGTTLACDHNTFLVIEVTKRTEKTLWFIEEGYKERKTKIHLDNKGVEYIIPERYSMAPVWDANDMLASPMKPETRAMIDKYHMEMLENGIGAVESRILTRGYLRALWDAELITAEEFDEVLTEIFDKHPLEVEA